MDLADPAGLDLAREAWDRASSSAGRVRLVVYAAGALGAGLVAAQDVEAFLAAPEDAPANDPVLTDPQEWKRRAKVEELPTFLWKGGKRTAPVAIDEVFRAACGDRS